MVGRSHQMVGFACVYATALYFSSASFNTQTIVVGILFTTLGSLTPDLDSQENVLYNLVPIGHRAVADVFEKVFGKHRSISHSILGVFVFGYLSSFLIDKIPKENGLDLTALWVAYMISLISHLAADALTTEGIPLLWPVKIRFGFPPFSFLRFKTGGWFEKYVVRSILIVFIFGMTYFFWDRLIHLHS